MQSVLETSQPFPGRSIAPQPRDMRHHELRGAASRQAPSKAWSTPIRVVPQLMRERIICSNPSPDCPGPDGITWMSADPSGFTSRSSARAIISSSCSPDSSIQSPIIVAASGTTTEPCKRTIASTHWPTPESCLKNRGSTKFMLPVQATSPSTTTIFRCKRKSVRPIKVRNNPTGSADVSSTPASRSRCGWSLFHHGRAQVSRSTNNNGHLVGQPVSRLPARHRPIHPRSKCRTPSTHFFRLNPRHGRSIEESLACPRTSRTCFHKPCDCPPSRARGGSCPLPQGVTGPVNFGQPFINGCVSDSSVIVVE